MARSSDAAFPLSLVRDRTFQLCQVRRVLWLTAFFIIQSTILLGVFYHNLLGELVEGTAPLLFASEELALISERIPDMSTVVGHWLVAMLLINAIVTAIIGVYIVRKLGNPMLAIRRALNEIGDGNLQVRLRSGDSEEFSELCEALNRALESVQAKVEEARGHTCILDSLEDQPSPDQVDVEQALRQCRASLDYFAPTHARQG